MPKRRSLAWQIVPWLVPVVLIVVGLVFIVASTAETHGPKAAAPPAAPTNVTAAIAAAAVAWAHSQVGAGIDTMVQDVFTISSQATGASTYSARAVVVRLDSHATTSVAGAAIATLPDSAHSTVATCVLFDVNVTTKSAVARAATEVLRESGTHTVSDTDSLRRACAVVAFGG